MTSRISAGNGAAYPATNVQYLSVVTSDTYQTALSINGPGKLRHVYLKTSNATYNAYARITLDGVVFMVDATTNGNTGAWAIPWNKNSDGGAWYETGGVDCSLDVNFSQSLLVELKGSTASTASANIAYDLY